MEKANYNPYTNAQQQFDHVADQMELSQDIRSFLRQPMREYHFTIPVKMDDGSTKTFNGYRVHHNTARGPAKGGIRFHPEETVDTVRGLSLWMTWKCAVVNIPLGGGKGGVVCDPRELSLREQEGLCRGYIRALHQNVGPEIDVPAPDVMTNKQHMLWMLDEYETITGKRQPGMITGKPVGMGGSLGRTEATGYGVIYVLDSYLKTQNIDIKNTTASLQGFGNVAEYTALKYTELGGTIKAISSWDNNVKQAFTYTKAEGIDVKELLTMKDQYGNIDSQKAKAAGYELLPGNAWLSQDVDILIPAALENQLTADTVGAISQQVKVVCEAANGPTTPDADPILAERGIALLPDFLCNAGGVTCSYFEQVQSNMNFFWSLEEVYERLENSMVSAFQGVYETAQERGINYRDAAYVIAIQRVVEAVTLRGWI